MDQRVDGDFSCGEARWQHNPFIHSSLSSLHLPSLRRLIPLKKKSTLDSQASLAGGAEERKEHVSKKSIFNLCFNCTKI